MTIQVTLVRKQFTARWTCAYHEPTRCCHILHMHFCQVFVVRLFPSKYVLAKAAVVDVLMNGVFLRMILAQVYKVVEFLGGGGRYWAQIALK